MLAGSGLERLTVGGGGGSSQETPNAFASLPRDRADEGAPLSYSKRSTRSLLSFVCLLFMPATPERGVRNLAKIRFLADSVAGAIHRRPHDDKAMCCYSRL